MKIETINNQRILTPDNEMWLLNAKCQVISDKVYLGIEADESDWTEITSEDKARFEALWNGETSTDPNEATTADLYGALTKLGIE